jgi:SAM-dependent methyltransferase
MQPLNSTYDDNPERYDRLRDCWLNRRHEEFIAARLNCYQRPADSLVLEIGSGTGWLLNRLGARFPALRFAGVEPIAGYVEYAQKNAAPNVRYLASTLEQADALAESPRAVLSNDVLHHVPSYEEALRAAARLAAPACRWLAIEPNCKNLYTFVKQATGYGEQNFWPGRFRRMAAREGWRLDGKGHLFLVPPSVDQPPQWMQAIERFGERVPFLAGGVYLEFTLGPAAGGSDGEQNRRHYESRHHVAGPVLHGENDGVVGERVAVGQHPDAV